MVAVLPQSEMVILYLMEMLWLQTTETKAEEGHEEKCLFLSLCFAALSC